VTVRSLALVLCASLFLPACAGDNDLILADAAHEAGAAAAARALLLGHARDLRAAAVTLQGAAPAPDADGWSAASDPAAVLAMQAAWKDARRAYQSIEGAMDLLFPDLDATIDVRYDDALQAGPDPDPFNGEGFVGLHAIERILWADAIDPSVVAFESTLEGYAPAASPANAEEAGDFQGELCARLIADAEALGARIEALDLESPAIYEAAVLLIEGQLDKLDEAAGGRDESRYAGYSLADMRANVASAAATHAVFRTWLLTRSGGAHVDGEIATGFTRIDQAYAALPGDALPAAPPGWSSAEPSGAALETPFGALFAVVREEADDTRDGSLAHSMDEAAGLLGIGGE
jgi:iron uptake system component EfeO